MQNHAGVLADSIQGRVEQRLGTTGVVKESHHTGSCLRLLTSHSRDHMPPRCALSIREAVGGQFLSVCHISLIRDTRSDAARRAMRRKSLPGSEWAISVVLLREVTDRLYTG